MKWEILTWFKIVGATAIAWAISFIWPISHFIALAVCLSIVDFVTGVRAAKLRGEQITSKGYRRTINKLTLYSLSVMLAEGMEWVFFENHAVVPITYVIAAFLCVTEFKSVLENVGSITGVNAWVAVRQYLEKFLPSNTDKK